MTTPRKRAERPEGPRRPGLFPCFLTVDAVPPLVIGNAAILEAKIRLLLKFAPCVDLVTDLRPVSRLGADRRVRVLDSPRARSLIPNRRVRSPRRRDHQPD